MADWSASGVFLAASLALLLTPGPAVLYIVARSIDQGRVAGVISALGVGVGTLFHVMAAALGVSALLVSSALAFSIVKYLGAAYLIYLGLQKLLAKEQATQVQAGSTEPRGLSRVFWQGVVVNVLNPKTALFFFAFLPQFANPASGSVAAQIALLGIIFVLLGIVSDGLYALLAGTVGQWTRNSLSFVRSQRYVAGSIYIALGVATALSGSKKT